MILELATWTMYFISTYYAVFLLLIAMEKGIDTTTKKTAWKPHVTIAIPAINEEKTIEKTINSVLRMDYPKNKLHLTIVDDGSTDNTLSILHHLQKKHNDYDINIIKHERNKGKGAALNTALNLAKTELFICLDADSFVNNDTLLNIVPHFEHDNDVASVLPFMKINTTHNFITKIQWVEYLMNFFLKKISSTINCIHVTPGPFGSYRTSILKKLGGFDEHNLTEDLEMAIRLQQHHYKIIQLLDANVTTVPPDTVKGFYKQRNRWYKGTLYNIYHYKHLLFNSRYGEFGIFHFPMVFTAALLSISFAFLIIFYRLVKPALTKLYDLSFINFDLPLMIKIGAQRFHLLDFNYTMIYLTILIFAFALTWIISSHRYSNESYTKKGLGPSLLFLAIYPVILSIIWIGVFYDLCRKKRQQW